MSGPRTLVVEHDGLRHAVLDWGGAGETLLLLHPNGLCAGFFDPIARRLTDTFRVVGVDLRGHGGSDAPATRDGLRYVPMAADVLAVLDALGVDSFVALGESLGGGVGLTVDQLRPGAMRHLVLCEAIAFARGLLGGPSPDAATGATRAAAEAASTGASAGASPDAERRNPMADRARARRAVWPNRETVRARYSSRPPFDAVAPEALDAYLRWGFVERPDGQVELACPPEVEATIFEIATAPGVGDAAFDHLARMRGRVTVLNGDASDLPAAWFRAQADAAGTVLHTVAGGHFFLHEDTARGEELVRRALARRPGGEE